MCDVLLHLGCRVERVYCGNEWVAQVEVEINTCLVPKVDGVMGRRDASWELGLGSGPGFSSHVDFRTGDTTRQRPNATHTRAMHYLILEDGTMYCQGRNKGQLP